jgi:tRNA pseudouridine13 synthase
LAGQGVPNFFGEQRFGNRINNHILGELLLRQDATEFMAEFLGRPQAGEAPSIRQARHLFDEGRWSEARQYWPVNFSEERRVLLALSRPGVPVSDVFQILDKRLKYLLVSAFQAHFFNALLVQRLPDLARLERGDIAYLHRNGAAFVVEDPVLEQARADRFEISPSGPLFGPKILLAEAKPGERERAILAGRGLTVNSFKVPGLKLRGVRRPYRIELAEAKVWWDQGVVVSFRLPAGSYATTVMAEVMKNQDDEGLAEKEKATPG